MAILGTILSSLAGGLLSNQASQSAKPIALDIDKIRNYLKPTQGLVTEQLGLGRQLQDPNSAVNKAMHDLLVKGGYNNAAVASNQMGKLGSMTGMSPGQIAMQQRMSSNENLGGINDKWMEMLQNRFGIGTGIMGQMTGLQQGLDENLANAYVQNTNATNQYNTDRANSTTSGLLGGLALGIQNPNWLT
jgi:hypothetical protein